MTMDGCSLLLLLIISTFELLIAGRTVKIADSKTARYAIVFDAGASKTKMEIYKIKEKSPPLNVTDIQQLNTSPSKVTPGIAELSGNRKIVEDYLKPLLTTAMKTVPKQKHKSTPIFFLATGGMRTLREDQANAILKEVKKLLNDKNKCPFVFSPKNAKIISGKLEGVYAWISINFLKSKFLCGNSPPTYGILDEGGASSQNTFESPGKDAFALTVGGKKYGLSTKSYLGYGLDQARNRYLAIEILSQQSLTNGVVKSPCHLKGFREQISISDKKLTIVGTASVDACRSIIEKTFFCKTPDCKFNDQPSLRGEFFAFAGIFYTARATGMLRCPNCTTPLSAAMFDKSSRIFCAKKYQDVSRDPYAKNNCFQSNFVYELLTKGYGLPADKMIQVGKELKGFSLGWTLGAMLYNLKLL